MEHYPRWVWRKAEPASLARFVNPSCAAGVVPRVALADGRSVHDAVRAGDRVAVLSALYAAVAELGIDYDVESYTPDGQHSQAVRSPPEIRDRRRATCLDLALLMAGLALDLTLRPIVIVLQGHALIAVLDVGYGLEIDPSLEKDVLLGWMTQEPAVLIPLECTGAARGETVTLDFDAARQAGRRAVEDRELLFAIDPHRLHREQGLAPLPCTPPRRRWLLPAAAALGVLTAGGVAARALWEPVPVFGTGVEGVVVPAVQGADGVAEWAADGLRAAAADPRAMVDVQGCGQRARLDVWGPDRLRRVDLTDPVNPSNVDLVLRGTRVPTSAAGDELYVTLDIEPVSTEVAAAADPVLLTLGSSPARVDLQRDPLVIYPELAVLPALTLGLRQLELGSDEGLEQAVCLFGAAEAHLADSRSPRVQRYRAVVAVLAANGLVLHASGLPEEQEQAHLDQARELLATAEEHLTDPADLAVVRANGMATQVLALITDTGRLAADVPETEVDALVSSLEAMAQEVSPVSVPAAVTMHSLAAKLHLAAHSRDRDPARLDRALTASATALDRAGELSGPQGRRQLAEAHEVRGIALLVADDPTAALRDFEAAAALTDGVLAHDYRLQAAAARILRCAEGDRAAVDDILADIRLYLDSHDSGALAERARATQELAGRHCPA